MENPQQKGASNLPILRAAEAVRWLAERAAVGRTNRPRFAHRADPTTPTQKMIKAILRKTPDIHPLENIRVIDGDTIEAQILLPFEQRVQKRIRLKGWWADEIGGLYNGTAVVARFRLECFIQGKALWLHAPSCRLDRYGRVVGSLMHGERIVTAQEVLGDLQLTEKDHKAHRDAEKASRATPPAVALGLEQPQSPYPSGDAP